MGAHRSPFQRLGLNISYSIIKIFNNSGEEWSIKGFGKIGRESEVAVPICKMSQIIIIVF